MIFIASRLIEVTATRLQLPSSSPAPSPHLSQSFIELLGRASSRRLSSVFGGNGGVQMSWASPNRTEWERGGSVGSSSSFWL